MGKTDGMLDLIGSRLDQRPAPIIYVGPTRDFVVDQFEPRLAALLDEAPSLRLKVARGKRTKKARKVVAGVAVRLAHGGSSAALKSDPAALAFVDEYDEMLANVKGQGDPLGLVEARGFSYADYLTVIASTPSQGQAETETDPVSGIEFWKEGDPADVGSPIWVLLQEGTRFHWAWPCPHCGDYFVPRLSCMSWPKGASPAHARRTAAMNCPRCGVEIDEACKPAMNDAGRYVAPGQTIDRDGTVRGETRDTSTCSFWVSGLASPFVTWGDRVEAYLKALATGEDDKVQTAINAGFGELFALGAGRDMMEWQEVRAKCLPYHRGDAPVGVLRVVAGVDVQKRSLIYVTRGFGARGASWLLDYGQFYGPTNEDDVWDQLADMLLAPLPNGLRIERAFIDSGFRPDKPDAGDMHRVYRFCRDYSWIAWATKGHDVQSTPIRPAQIEVDQEAKRVKYSLTLMHLSSDHFKSEVHSRLRLSVGAVGGLHLFEAQSETAPDGVGEDYCREIVSEARVIGASNKPVWVRKSRANHYLDCEALAHAAAYTLRVQAIPDGVVREDAPPAPDRPSAPAVPASKSLRDRFAERATRLNR